MKDCEHCNGTGKVFTEEDVEQLAQMILLAAKLWGEKG